jgi:hypothetical protein
MWSPSPPRLCVLQLSPHSWCWLEAEPWGSFSGLQLQIEMCEDLLPLAGGADDVHSGRKHRRNMTLWTCAGGLPWKDELLNGT